MTATNVSYWLTPYSKFSATLWSVKKLPILGSGNKARGHPLCIPVSGLPVGTGTGSPSGEHHFKYYRVCKPAFLILQVPYNVSAVEGVPLDPFCIFGPYHGRDAKIFRTESVGPRILPRPYSPGDLSSLPSWHLLPTLAHPFHFSYRSTNSTDGVRGRIIHTGCRGRDPFNLNLPRFAGRRQAQSNSGHAESQYLYLPVPCIH